MSTPGSEPALRVRLACAQAPSDGVQTSSLGRGVFSLAAPVHQRGPFCGAFEGESLIEPRPGDVVRHGPGAFTLATRLRMNVALPPKRAVFEPVTGVAGAYDEADASPSVALRGIG